MNSKPVVGITGATGFVGKNLVEFLIKNGFSILALVRSQQTQIPGVEFLRGDLKNPKDVEQFISKVDVCVHLASVLNEDEKNRFQDNITFTKNLKNAIKNSGRNIKLLNISTLAVYNFAPGRYLERTKYAHSKLMADKELTSDIDYSTIYLGLIYGQGDKNFLPTIINGLNGFKICGIPFRVLMLKGSKKPSPLIYALDACELIHETIINGKFKGEKIIGVGHTESLYECVNKLSEILELKKPIYIPTRTPFLLMANLVEKGLGFFNKKAPYFLSIRSISVLGISLNVEISQFDNASLWGPKATFEANAKKLFL